MSFGPYLRGLRQQKGIFMEAVAAEIKISLHQLEQIEAEDHDRLPDDVFVRGILRSYARFIGVDENDIIDRYMICRRALGKSPRSLPGQSKERRKFKPGASLLLGILLILIVMSVLYMVYETSLPSSSLMTQERIGEASAVHQAHRLSFQDGNPDVFRLELAATEKTWVKIHPDEEEPLEYILYPMDHIELAISRRVRLQIGNAAGLNIRLNEQSVTVPGKSGETVTLDLPLTDSRR